MGQCKGLNMKVFHYSLQFCTQFAAKCDLERTESNIVTAKETLSCYDDNISQRNLTMQDNAMNHTYAQSLSADCELDL